MDAAERHGDLPEKKRQYVMRNGCGETKPLRKTDDGSIHDGRDQTRERKRAKDNKAKADVNAYRYAIGLANRVIPTGLFLGSEIAVTPRYAHDVLAGAGLTPPRNGTSMQPQILLAAQPAPCRTWDLRGTYRELHPTNFLFHVECARYGTPRPRPRSR